MVDPGTLVAVIDLLKVCSEFAKTVLEARARDRDREARLGAMHTDTELSEDARYTLETLEIAAIRLQTISQDLASISSGTVVGVRSVGDLLNAFSRTIKSGTRTVSVYH